MVFDINLKTPGQPQTRTVIPYCYAFTTPYAIATLRITHLRRQLLSINIFTWRTTWLDGPLVSYIHMPACQQPAGPHPQCLALGRQQGGMQQGCRQPGPSRSRVQQDRTRPPCGGRSCFAAPPAGTSLGMLPSSGKALRMQPCWLLACRHV